MRSPKKRAGGLGGYPTGVSLSFVFVFVFFFIIPLLFASRDKNSIDLNEERHFLSEEDRHDEKMRVFFFQFIWVREKGGARCETE